MTSATCAGRGGKANRAGDRSVIGSGPIGPVFLRLRKLFRDLWPAKASLEYSWRTGVSEKTGYRVIEGEREPSSAALIALLRGPEGGEIYDAIMDGCAEQHWRDYQRGRAVGAGVRRMRQIERDVEAAIKAAD